MDATPINFEAVQMLGPTVASRESSTAIARKWAALHDAAFVVAALAGATQPPSVEELGPFAAAVAGAPRWLRDLAEQGVDDLVAIMEPGLAALVAVHGQGGDAGPPARALWQEFTAARDGLLGLLVPQD